MKKKEKKKMRKKNEKGELEWELILRSVHCESDVLPKTFEQLPVLLHSALFNGRNPCSCGTHWSF
jgi:hypothetical protein